MENSSKVDRLKISNILSVLSFMGTINFWVAALSGLYNHIGWYAPLDIGLASLVVGFILAIAAAGFKRHNVLAWFSFAAATMTILLFLAFAFSFKFKM